MTSRSTVDTLMLLILGPLSVGCEATGETDQSFPPSAEVKNAWCYAFLPPDIVMVGYSIKHRGKFNFNEIWIYINECLCNLTISYALLSLHPVCTSSKISLRARNTSSTKSYRRKVRNVQRGLMYCDFSLQYLLKIDCTKFLITT
jgi:hypothetical protein